MNSFTRSRVTLVALLSSFATISLFAQWTDIDPAISSAARLESSGLPVQRARTLSLDADWMANHLRLAPMENPGQLTESHVEVRLPLPGGGFLDFRVVESPVMAPGLAARYPHHKTYLGQSIDGRHQVRLGMTPLGFHATFQSAGGDVFIDRYKDGTQTLYASYYQKDLVVDGDIAEALACGFDPAQMKGGETLAGMAPGATLESRSSENTYDRKKYRLALACTGEYSETKGFDTKDEVMASFVEALNLVNAIFEREVAVRLELIENNDNLIFLDSATDPYTTADVGSSLLGQNTPVIGQYFPPQSYDLGHVFTGPCTDVGGVVSGSTCGSGKARGVTCHYTNNLNAIVRRVMAHEIGHQFSASHSWSNCPSSMGQLASGWAYEPGSGSTIMSYAGSCGPQNVQFNSDDYYNVGALVQFIGFSRDGGGSVCGVEEETGNIAPEVNLPYENGFYIPISTPFQLNASAFDPDTDSLSYTWEQYDLGPVSDLGDPVGDSPAFRTFPPTLDSFRVFPRRFSLLNNQSEVTEVLPTYSRKLTFRCTVRDYFPGGGAAIWKEVAFEATESAGPFLVTSPNTGSDSWKGGDYREVSWDVANTDNSLVNCQFVNIMLSLDGGYTYPYTLLKETPNDGSAFVTVPKVVSTKARIRVEAANNIFFDISNQNFTIEEPTAPGFTLELAPVFQRICLPASATIALTTDSILGYQDTIALEIVSDLPDGVTVSLSQDSLLPGQPANLELDFSGVNMTQEFELALRAIAPNADTALRSIGFRLVSNDFDDLSLTGPVDGENGIGLSTDFSWTAAANASTYDIELATSPAFGETVVESATGLTDAAYSPDILFEENTLYYWRVRPHNECGPGAWLLPSGFHTVNAQCNPRQPSDIPINISGTGTPTVESSIFVTDNGTVSDINIPRIVGSYQPVNSLRISLTSPSGTEVVLFDQNCGATVQFDIGFDDDAPNEITCPPDDGIVFQPVGSLSDFIGESIQGEWILKVEVVEGGFGGGGGLEQWGLEFCASIVPNAPYMVTNDSLITPPSATSGIYTTLLEAADEDNTTNEIIYTLVSVPRHGLLSWFGVPLEVGDEFSQSHINAYGLEYTHQGDTSQFDQFAFTVKDGTGGWIPTQYFQIRLDEDALVGTRPEMEQLDLTLYPNPASESVFLRSGSDWGATATWQLFNLQGQLLRSEKANGSQETIEVGIADLPVGMYVLKVQSDHKVASRKFSVQR